VSVGQLLQHPFYFTVEIRVNRGILKVWVSKKFTQQLVQPDFGMGGQQPEEVIQISFPFTQKLVIVLYK
jgi:hypothetical protein